MEVFAQAFWLPKAGNSEAEYEDAFSPPEGGRKTRFRFAVADGATATSYSGIWAKQLVGAFAKGRIRSPTIGKDLAPLQQLWGEEVRRKPLPWYAEEKLRSGTFAAFLGLSLSARSANAGRGQWQALAVGDCCLAHVRRDKVLASFPITAAVDFNDRPFLVSSHPRQNGSIEQHIRTRHGTWITEDTFFLMTDALAHWFYSEMEQDRRPWATLRDLDTEEVKPFAQWISGLRSEHAIPNDDVTLLRIDII